MRRTFLAALMAMFASVACLYDFEADYQNCRSFGRCAAAADGGAEDAGVDAGNQVPDGGDAGIDAGYSWSLVRTIPRNPRMWGLWAFEPGRALFVGAVPGGGRGPVAEFISGNWVQNDYGVYVGPYPAIAATEDQTCILGYYGGARTLTFLNGSWDGGTFGTGYDHFGSYEALWSAGSSFWIGGRYGRLVRSVGSGWLDAGALASGSEIVDGWASSETNQYVVTYDNTFWHFDGGGWTPITTRPDFAAAIWGVSPTEVWGAGTGIFRFRDGKFDTFDAGPENWYRIWASGPNDVFVVGKDGWVAHWNGSSFERTRISPYNLAAVHGTGPADVWAADIDGGIYHYGP